MPDIKLNKEKLLDKLSERWLFEKKSVALYDQIIEKLQSLGADVKMEDIKRYRAQEQEHQRLLESYIKTLGGSVRRKTPSQMLVEQESQAFVNIVEQSEEPSHLLHVLLDAEMEDNASWELLIQLSKRVGQSDFIDQFKEAIEHERQHLRGIRALVTRLARHELIEEAHV